MGRRARAAAAKAGVDALTVGLPKELADQGVRVNAVAPGTVRTGFTPRPAILIGWTASCRRYLWGASGSLTRAPAFAWLLGADAAYVTGAIIRITGGL